MFPLTRVPFWAPIFEPQPHGSLNIQHGVPWVFVRSWSSPTLGCCWEASYIFAYLLPFSTSTKIPIPTWLLKCNCLLPFQRPLVPFFSKAHNSSRRRGARRLRRLPDLEPRRGGWRWQRSGRRAEEEPRGRGGLGSDLESRFLGYSNIWAAFFGRSFRGVQQDVDFCIRSFGLPHRNHRFPVWRGLQTCARVHKE